MGGPPRWPRARASLRAAPLALPGGLCAGLAVSNLWAPPAPVGGLLVALAGAAALWAIAGGHAAVALASLVVVGLWGGWAWGGARLAATAPPPLDLPAGVRGTVAVDGPPVRTERGTWRARAVGERLRSVDGGPIAPGTRILLELAPEARPQPGRVLRVRGRLRSAAGPEAPRWWRRYLARQAIAASMRPDAARPEGWRTGASAGERGPAGTSEQGSPAIGGPSCAAWPSGAALS